jgi:hypothetical protein
LEGVHGFNSGLIISPLSRNSTPCARKVKIGIFVYKRAKCINNTVESFLQKKKRRFTMDLLRGKKAIMAVDLPHKTLYIKDRIEILRSWKEPIFSGRDRLGKRRKLWIKSLDRPGVEAEVDFADVLIRE